MTPLRIFYDECSNSLMIFGFLLPLSVLSRRLKKINRPKAGFATGSTMISPPSGGG